MNSKTLIGALIGAVVMFLLGWLLYGMLFMNTLQNLNGIIPGVNKAPDDMSGMGSLFIGNFVYALLISYIFNVWANIKTISGGAQAGALIGFLISLSYGLMMHGTTNLVKIPGVLLDSVINAALTAGVGAAIGWWLGRGNK